MRTALMCLMSTVLVWSRMASRSDPMQRFLTARRVPSAARWIRAMASGVNVACGRPTWSSWA